MFCGGNEVESGPIGSISPTSAVLPLILSRDGNGSKVMFIYADLWGAMWFEVVLGGI